MCTIHIQRACLSLCLALIMLPVTSASAAPAHQASDPAAQVRAELQGQGYTVLEVGTNNAGDLAGVYMDMASPTFDDVVRRQVVAGWYAVSKAYPSLRHAH